MLRMRMFPCTLLDPVAFLTALCGVVRQEALGSDLRRMKGRKSGRVEEWKDWKDWKDWKGRHDVRLPVLRLCDIPCSFF